VGAARYCTTAARYLFGTRDGAVLPLLSHFHFCFALPPSASGGTTHFLPFARTTPFTAGIWPCTHPSTACATLLSPWICGETAGRRVLHLCAGFWAGAFSRKPLLSSFSLRRAGRRVARGLYCRRFICAGFSLAAGGLLPAYLCVFCVCCLNIRHQRQPGFCAVWVWTFWVSFLKHLLPPAADATTLSGMPAVSCVRCHRRSAAFFALPGDRRLRADLISIAPPGLLRAHLRFVVCMTALLRFSRHLTDALVWFRTTLFFTPFAAAA